MLLCVLFLPAVLAAQVPDAPNLEQILAKHFEAMGGLDKLASVKTVRITATIPKSTGSESIVFESAPGFTCRHSKIDLGNVFVESIVVTSPKGGWRSSPFANSGKPVEYDIKERKRRWNDPSSVIFSHVGSSPFVGYKEKGLKAEYLGLGDYADGKAHKVSLEYPDDGYTLIYFLDAKSYLPAKVETKYPDSNYKYPIFAFDDYKKVNGINVPHAWTDFKPGTPGDSSAGLPNIEPSQEQATVQKIEINPKISDSSFLPRAVPDRIKF